MGQLMTVEEVVQVANKDTLFYRNSGGGVTASGGEPTHQAEFVKALLNRCQESGLHTALDTCGLVEWEVLEEILEHVDLVLFDLKHMDSEEHRKLTGVGNEIILRNLERLAKVKPVVVRVPLIPGLTDSKTNIEASGEFLARIGVSRVDVVPYHQLGVGKYERLGKKYPLPDVDPMSDEGTDLCIQVLERYGLEVDIA